MIQLTISYMCCVCTLKMENSAGEWAYSDSLSVLDMKDKTTSVFST